MRLSAEGCRRSAERNPLVCLPGRKIQGYFESGGGTERESVKSICGFYWGRRQKRGRGASGDRLAEEQRDS